MLNLVLIIEAHSKKISKGTYEKKIANYEEVKDTLSGTKFERFLIDG